MTVQPELDLFEPALHDDTERIAETFRRDAAEQRALWQQPATCPSCGVTEPDGYALYRVHDLTPTRRYEPTWPCRAQRRDQP